MHDPTEWPEMKGSKRKTGQRLKPAVGPYRFQDYERIEHLALVLAENLKVPWQGDRLSEGEMRGILTLIWYLLNEHGYYQREEVKQSERRVRYITRPSGG